MSRHLTKASASSSAAEVTMPHVQFPYLRASSKAHCKVRNISVAGVDTPALIAASARNDAVPRASHTFRPFESGMAVVDAPMRSFYRCDRQSALAISSRLVLKLGCRSKQTRAKPVSQLVVASHNAAPGFASAQVAHDLRNLLAT